MAMEHRTLGRTGISVSRYGLGTMVLGEWGNRDLDDCERLIQRALDAGINLIDTADMYADGQNEELVGRAIRSRRDDVVLCTKFHHPVGDHGDPNRRGNSRRWIMRAIDDSLRRLAVDHVDLYQVHRPDPSVDISETVSALNDLVRAGKIRAWGTSTFPAEEIVEAHLAARASGEIGPHSEQAPYSILCRGVEAAVLPTARRHAMGVLTWSPLSGGMLTGKHRRNEPPPPDSRAATSPDHFDGDNEEKHAAVDALRTIAAEAGLSLTHMAMAWNVEHPAVTSALIGPRTQDQLDDLLASADITLSTDVLDAIDHVVPPGRTLNPADVGWVPPGLARRHRRRIR